LNVAEDSASLTVLVLAAGLGKRMRSKTIKLLHPVAGRPMVAHVLAAARALAPRRIVTVVGHQAAEVRAALDGLSDAFVLQPEQRGTGDAVFRAARSLRASNGALLILNGDLPTVRTSTLQTIVSRHRSSSAALTLVGAEVEDSSGYGRIVRGRDGEIRRIVEDRDASPDEKAIREVNCGIYCADPSKLFPALRLLRPDNVQGEYYLTDAVHHLLAGGKKVTALRIARAEELLGVNDRAELARASKLLYARKAAELQASGVTILDPARTWVDPRARIGRDTVLYPDVFIEGASTLGEDCVVRAGCRLTDVVLGRGVEVRDHSVLVDSRVGDKAAIGPFAHLRPGSVLGPEVRIGNFVEIKEAQLGRGTKANHLSYLGDASIGAGSNIGAGTITCNYDGEKKHRTVLGRGVFIGSDTQLVAPVEVGNGAYVGAGTTVTEKVPAGALALSRTRQANIRGWVARHKDKKRKGARRR
jgi:bifunctional UDP-N-acetylglucosamine pyrophosphorylase/glucosamine-1-phosphate N-acetyltransferase